MSPQFIIIPLHVLGCQETTFLPPACATAMPMLPVASGLTSLVYYIKGIRQAPLAPWYASCKILCMLLSQSMSNQLFFRHLKLTFSVSHSSYIILLFDVLFVIEIKYKCLIWFEGRMRFEVDKTTNCLFYKKWCQQQKVTHKMV